MCFVLTFPRKGSVLAVRNSDRADKYEVSTSVFGVTTKDFSHSGDLDEASLSQLIQDKLKCGSLAGQEVQRNFGDTPRFVVSKRYLMRPTRPATRTADVGT